MAAIDIGYPAIDREAYLAGVRTAIMTGNPANAAGTITTVEVYAYTDMTLAEVATFYRPNPVSYPNKLTTRDWEAIGTVTAGSKQSFTVNLDVQIGDYIGIKWQSGSIERYIVGGDGFWHTSSDQIPCTNYEFAFGANWIASLYGYSEAPPDPPTNVQASDGTYTDKVAIRWTKSDGATGYQVYRDGTPLGWLGDVDTYDDTGADAPTITPGTAFASDGRNADYVTLNITGESANNGTVHVYKVRARNAAGESGDSLTDTGFRGVGALTYQWQRSAADSDASYSDIIGATTDPYNDTGAPSNGDGRYYKCIENATGVSGYEQTNTDRGYRAPAGTIDIGNPGIRRGYILSSTVVYTVVSKNNPANASGVITSVELFCSTDLLDVEVATFYRPDPSGFPNNLTTRDTEYIGTVTGGAQRTFAVDLDVEVGDYIGCVASNNSAIYLDIENGDGTWYAANDHIPCTNQLFSLAAWILSLNGISTVPVGIKWNGITISKWNGKVISKFNGIG